MTGPIAIANLAAAGFAAAHLQARQLSSQTATCSYAVAPRSRKRLRDAVACRAAPVEVAEEPEPAEVLSDDEELPDEILKLLGPRTTPTPILSPEEVAAPPMTPLAHAFIWRIVYVGRRAARHMLWLLTALECVS